MKKSIIITGQTGTGKTALAIHLAKEVQGEILSADARQIYKKLNIITGKDVGLSTFVSFDTVPLEHNRVAEVGYYTINGIRVWGYDLVEPRSHFSSYDYKVVANFILRNAIAETSKPIIVGGTHLYIKHLTQDFDIEVAPDWELRNELEELTTKQLQDKLESLDKNTYVTMNSSDRSNPRRLMRKIEIAVGGQGNKKAREKTSFGPILYTKKIGLRFTSTEACREVIRSRIDKRLNEGALQEVKELLKFGYTIKDPGLQTIGYKELIEHIQGTTTFEEAKELWLNAEVQYAKRQLSFMKQDTEIKWQMV